MSYSESAGVAFTNSSLTPAYITRLRDLFRLLDERGHGTIHVRDLPVALSLADLEATADERTGLIAVHCANKDAGLTEAEFLNICDVIYSARKDVEEYSDENMLRKAFDALASNEHGVVPIEGVLNWGDEVMKACEECLLLEHGFPYGEDVEALLQRPRRKTSTGSDDDDDERTLSSLGGGGRGGKEGIGISDFKAPKLQKPDRELKFGGGGGGSRAGGSDDDDYDEDAPKPRRLQRRRSSSQMLVPDPFYAAADESPAQRLKLPEVAAQQRATGNRCSASSSKNTAGDKNLISHHSDASSIFDSSDVEATTNWLLGTMAERYATASDGEKREIEMLLELARAAGHNVESVKGILTRDAFVSLLKEAHREQEEEAVDAKKRRAAY